ncbi:MAG: acetyl/propionyl/methylcrotonyl-CoA carboxylase subunit alpha [Candidatus Velamenicoccus archaeovorus]
MDGPIQRLLIANRGEIAVRIIRACRDLGIEAVVTYSEADRDSLAVRMADRAICVGPGQPSASYLNIANILGAAIGWHCDAVHPGYGFLAEHAGFANACEEAGLRFVGPRSETIQLLGDKIAARRTAQELGIPVLPGSASSVRDVAAARELGERLGYPLLIKAGGGGGGRGLRLVEDPEQLEGALAIASSEASAAFQNDAVYIEKYVRHARHVEIQVAVDPQGQAVHFGERDCSIQRNYQKLVEESPSPAVSPAIRERMAGSALRLVRHVGYLGVGTVEFLLDQDSDEFFFIEMNTRLQVEHPVTEIVTGVDLVILQLEIASGRPLSLQQRDIGLSGHAIEFRINAEDPARGFLPSAGRLDVWHAPQGPWIRTDTHCYPGYVVPPFYDSLLAKVIVSGATREEALRRARRALAEHEVLGVPTSLTFHRWLLEQEDFVGGTAHTAWTREAWNGGAPR